ncbi:MAG: MsnO8 family LLM class oxidoreductase [Pseudomonadota bacterium]
MAAPILSVLDPSPVFEGRSATDALNETRALAEAADAMGLRSYWVQEHHNAPSFAGTTPEVLIADLAARTRQIKVGSGGVMLPNYSPLKVAEQFMALEALNPGRIELGLGRATGADPRASAALLGWNADSFPQMLGLLQDWLLDASGEQPLPDGHRAAGIHANPAATRPDLWMLSSSASSAAFAGAMGLKLAFADFLAPGGAVAALQAYREAFKPSAFAAEPWGAIGLVALAAETEAEAHRLAQSGAAWNVARARGAFMPFPPVDQAEALLAAAGEDAVAAARSRARVGNEQSVAAGITDLCRQAGADEVFVLTIADSAEARIASYRLLKDALSA